MNTRKKSGVKCKRKSWADWFPNTREPAAKACASDTVTPIDRGYRYRKSYLGDRLARLKYNKNKNRFMLEDIAFILGALEDGNFYSRPEIGEFLIEVEQKNKKWLEILAKAFKNSFQIEPKIKKRKDKNGIFRLRIYSKEIFQKLQELKSKSNWLLQENQKVKIAFLRGIFDAEGSVIKNKNRITLSNKNEELLRLCQNLLLDLGIKTGKIWNLKWGVKVLPINGRENIEKFNQIIGFSHPLKRKKLENKLKCLANPQKWARGR